MTSQQIGIDENKKRQKIRAFLKQRITVLVTHKSSLEGMNYR